MPRRASTQNQCCYKERGRKCRRTGTGNPPLCQPHKIAFQEAARAATEPRMPGARVFDLFESMLTGKRVSRKNIEAAWVDAQDFLRQQVPMPDGAGGGWTPPPSSSPPPPDPLADARREFENAKLTMGFARDQRITASDVHDRRKQLARKWHPDLPGGSLEKMQEINAAAEVLLRKRKAA